MAAGKDHSKSVQTTPAQDSTLRVESSDWVRFVQDPVYRKFVELRVGVTLQLIEKVGLPQCIGHIGSGVGVIGHLLASEGLPYIGVDSDNAKVVFSRVSTRGQCYPQQSPRFEKQPDPRRLPLDDASVDLLLMFDQLHTHAKPEELWYEAERVLQPEKYLILVHPRKEGSFEQLIDGVKRSGAFEPVLEDSWNDPLRDLVVVAKRVARLVRQQSAVGDACKPAARHALPTIRVK